MSSKKVLVRRGIVTLRRLIVLAIILAGGWKTNAIHAEDSPIASDNAGLAAEPDTPPEPIAEETPPPSAPDNLPKEPKRPRVPARASRPSSSGSKTDTSSASSGPAPSIFTPPSGISAPAPLTPKSVTPSAASPFVPDPAKPAAPLKAPSPFSPSPAPSPDTGTATPSGSTPPGTAATTALPQEDVGEGVYLNATELDIKELIKQISKATGKNFLLDDNLRGKVTIISESKMTLEEAYQAFLSALSVAGYTTVEGPVGLIKVIPLKEAIQYPINIFSGTSPITDNFITRVIHLTNISALDISTVIKAMISKDGNMIAYPPTNTLMITDTGSNIARVMQIIKELDKEGPQQTIEIIHIEYATAKDITDKLNQLFADESQGKAGNQPRRLRTPDAKGGAAQEDVPAISKIIPDDRTNSVIVLGSKRGISDIREIIAKLDSPLLGGAEGSIHVHYLQNAVATELASVLASLTGGSVSKKGGSTAASTGTGGTSTTTSSSKTATPVLAEFEGGLKVTADESTNALIIVSSPKDYQTLVEKVISKLDIPRRQVYLEALVMELRMDRTTDFGISAQGGKSLSLLGGNLLGLGTLFGGATTASLAALGGLAGGLVSQSTVSVPVTQNGTTTNVALPALGMILNAQQANANAQVLSTPSLLTLDNQEAQILVGSQVPFQTGSTVNATGTATQITREDVGIILKITPQINESDNIRLKISQELSSVVSTTAKDPNGPTTNKSTVSTVVVAENQQTIVIGGLLQNNAQINVLKVPLFGDIPLFGNLFKSQRREQRRDNLLIFITPYIIRDRSDFLVILKKKIEERNQFIDYSYGRSARSDIRKSIERHANTLLNEQTVEQNPFDPYKASAPAPIPRTSLSPKPIKPAPIEKESVSRVRTSDAERLSPTTNKYGRPISPSQPEAVTKTTTTTSTATSTSTAPAPTPTTTTSVTSSTVKETKPAKASKQSSGKVKEKTLPTSSSTTTTETKTTVKTEKTTTQSAPSAVDSSGSVPTSDQSQWSGK